MPGLGLGPFRSSHRPPIDLGELWINIAPQCYVAVAHCMACCFVVDETSEARSPEVCLVTPGLAHSTTPQALQDSRHRAAAPGEDITLAEMEEWRSLSAKFVSGGMVAVQCHDEEEDEGSPQNKVVKIFRVASYHHLVAMHNQLHQLVPGGLSRFMPQLGDDQKPLTQRSWLVSNEDHGPDCECTKWFRLFALKTRELEYGDPWHEFWNDFLNAAKHTGYFSTMLTTALAHNVSFGPFQGCAWWQEILEGAKDYMGMADSSDPLFMFMAEGILKSRGESLECNDEQLPDLFRSLKGELFLRAKGPRTATGRWLSWMVSHYWWRQQWHSRGLFLLFLGLQLGYVTSSADGAALQGLAGSADAHGKDVEKKSLAQNKSEMQRLRDGAKNTLHLACNIHCHKDTFEKAEQLFFVSTPLSSWYAEQRRLLRSREACFDYLVSYANGESHLERVREISMLFADLGSLSSMGFEVDSLASNSHFKKLTQDHPFVAMQNEKMQQVARLSTELVKRRFLTLARHSHAYPKKFVLLLHADPAVRNHALESAELMWKAWEAACASRLPTWRRLCRKSCMHLTACQDMFKALTGTDFKSVPEDLYQVLRDCASNFGSTGVTEDAFQRVGDRARDRPDKLVTATDAWHVPVVKEVLSSLYKYREVHTSAADIEKAAKKENPLPKEVNTPACRDCPKEFANIKGTKMSTDWPSFTSWSSCAQAEELEFMKFMFAHGCMDKVGSSWRTGVLHAGLVVSHKVLKAGKFFMALGCFNVAAALWPVEKVLVGKSWVWTLARLSSAADIWWAPVLDFGDWLVIETAAASPAQMFVAGGCKFPGAWPDGFALQTSTDPAPLLPTAARNGFWDLKAGFIMKLIKEELGEEQAQGESFPSMLLRAIQLVLECSSAEAAQILEQRVQAVEAIQLHDILESEEAQDCLDENDKKVVKSMGKQQQSALTLAVELQKTIRHARSSGAAPATKRARKGVQYPSKKDWKQEDVQRLAPPKARIYKDNFNGCWRLWYGNHAHGLRRWSTSKSWGLGGQDDPCVRYILKEGWLMHTALTGEKCPLEGL